MSLRSSAALVRCCAAARFPLRSHPPTFSPLRCDASLVSVAPFPLRCDASGEGPGLRRNSPGTLFLRFLRCAVDYPVSAAVPQRPPRSASALRERAPVSEEIRPGSSPSALLRCASIRQRFPCSAPTLRNRVHPSEKFGLNPVPPLYSAARLIFPFQLYFLRPESSSFGAGGCWHNVVPARK